MNRLVVLPLLLIAGCPSPKEIIKGRAAEDLDCAYTDITVAEVIEWAPNATPDGPRLAGYSAVGCGRAVVYHACGETHAVRCDPPTLEGCNDAATRVGLLASARTFPYSEPPDVGMKILLLYPGTERPWGGPDVYRGGRRMEPAAVYGLLGRPDLARRYEAAARARTTVMVLLLLVQLLAVITGARARFRGEGRTPAWSQGVLGMAFALFIVTVTIGPEPVDGAALAKLVREYNDQVTR